MTDTIQDLTESIQRIQSDTSQAQMILGTLANAVPQQTSELQIPSKRLIELYNYVGSINTSLQKLPTYTPAALTQYATDLRTALNSIEEQKSVLANSSDSTVQSVLSNLNKLSLDKPVEDVYKLSKQIGSEQLGDLLPNLGSKGAIANQVQVPKKTSNSTTQNNSPVDSWGVKFSFVDYPNQPLDNPPKINPPGSIIGPIDPRANLPASPTERDYYFSLLPAMASNLTLQGHKDTPNSLPGISYKAIPNIAKLKAPGFQPVFQHLGIDTLLVTLVGCFTGADGTGAIGERVSPSTTQDFRGRATFDRYGIPGVEQENALSQIMLDLDAYRNYQEFYQFAILQGKVLQVEINTSKSMGAATTGEASSIRSSKGNPKFKAMVKSLDVYQARRDRVWYTMQLEVTDHGLASKDPINLTNKLSDQIKKAQAEALKANQKTTKGDKTDSKAALDKLKETKYESWKLKDGSTLYRFSNCVFDPLSGNKTQHKGDFWEFLFDAYTLKPIRDPIVNSVVGAVSGGCQEHWGVEGNGRFTPIEPGDSLEALKSERVGDVSGGDLAKLAGTGLGCALSVGGIIVGAGATATGVGAIGGVPLTAGSAAGAALACGSLGLTVYDAYQRNSGIVEGLVEGTVGVFVPEFGKAGTSLAKPLIKPLVKPFIGTIEKVPQIGKAFIESNTTQQIVRITKPAVEAVTPTLNKVTQFIKPQVSRVGSFIKSKIPPTATGRAATTSAVSTEARAATSGARSTTTDTLFKTGLGISSSPIGKTILNGKLLTQPIGNFLSESGAMGRSLTKAVQVVTKDGVSLQASKVVQAGESSIQLQTASGARVIGVRSILEIKLPNGQVWRAP